jgi:predicted nucleic acid-binding protein
MVLADTSVWIEHFRRSDPCLVNALVSGQVSMHPIVIGELATGNLKNRARVLTDLHALPRIREATFEECLHLIEAQKLSGKGLGWNDVQLLAAARIEGLPLWTLDRALQRAAKALGVGYRGAGY